jgi:integrase
MTFKACAEAYIDAHRAGWRNAKHADQWANTLATYAYPIFGAVPVQAVDVGLIMKVLEPIWTTKTETASRVRGRIESVLDWAKARGYRRGDNPARWRGHLDNLLARQSKIQKVQHHAALPYGQIGTFVVNLRKQEGIAARALEFTILTAARTGETIGARREEINDDATVWTVPAKRMKVDTHEHRVPLSPAASAIAKHILQSHKGEFLFPGGKAKKPLSNMAMAAVLDRMGRDDITVHGFRSTFRDWAAEMTSFPREVAEMALAHVVDDKVEAAYRRGDLFEKRRRLMEAWATYCAKRAAGGKVVPIGRGKGG